MVGHGPGWSRCDTSWLGHLFCWTGSPAKGCWGSPCHEAPVFVGRGAVAEACCFELAHGGTGSWSREPSWQLSGLLFQATAAVWREVAVCVGASPCIARARILS